MPNRPMRTCHRGTTWRRAFTLLELIAVVVLIAIVAAVSVVGYRAAISAGQDAAVKESAAVWDRNYRALLAFDGDLSELAVADRFDRATSEFRGDTTVEFVEGRAMFTLGPSRGWLVLATSPDDPFPPRYSTIAPPTAITAAGGTVTDIMDSNGQPWRVHTFTSSGTFSIVSAPATVEVEYLVVAGGGAGGNVGQNMGSGGGGGGGRGVGSGSGGDTGEPGNSGGSGGGGGYRDAWQEFPQSGGSGNVPAVNPPQGNSGGSGGLDFPYGAGGGGGAGAEGGSGHGGAGGSGISSSISGELRWYAGGGGGGNESGWPASGGQGGGGVGALSYQHQRPGGDGTANTGGGGGGATNGNEPAGSGGSGIVIVRYRTGAVGTPPPTVPDPGPPGEESPELPEGLIGWYDASQAASLTVNGSGQVTAAANLSAAGNNLSATAPVGMSTMAGRNAFSFSGAGESLRSDVIGSLEGSTEMTVVTVAQIPQQFNGWHWAVDVGPNPGDNTRRHRLIGIDADGRPVAAAYNLEARSGVDSIVGTGPRVMTGRFSADGQQSVVVRVDGGQVGWTAVTPNGLVNPSISIGNATNYNEPWFGEVGEVLVFNRALTDTEARSVEQYLAAKWSAPMVP